MPLSVATRIDRLLARRNLVAASATLMGEYWHRPRELLVHRDDYSDRERFGWLPEELKRWEAEPVGLPRRLQYVAELDVPVLRFRLPPRMDVEAVVMRLRQVPDGPEPRVSPHHVFGAVQSWSFGPGDLPRPATAPPRWPSRPGRTEEGFAVGVVDSGIVLDQRHNPHLAAQQAMVLDPARDDDELDRHPADGMLDDVDVHGGFIADLVRVHAPKATVRASRVLLGGVADELQVADGILRMSLEARPVVLNLSLGGYTLGDVAPFVLVEALRRLRPRPVVVAAAGNYSRRRPFWPAALKGVVAVGAVDGRRRDPAGLPAPARFTNRGWWVDACAHGVDVVSSFVEFAETAPVPAAGPVTDPSPVPQSYTGWAAWSGTSFAAPLVAARVAERAMGVGGDPFTAAHAAAADLLSSGDLVPDLGAYVS